MEKVSIPRRKPRVEPLILSARGSPGKMDDDSMEACTPRAADETTPLQPSKQPRRRRLILGASVLTTAALGYTGRSTATALFGWSPTYGNDYQCREGGYMELSKYTMTTSSPELDAEFAMRVFGATDQLTGGEADLAADDATNLDDPSTYWDCNGSGDKIVHIRKLAFGAVKPMELHFPYIRDITPTGPLDVAYWDGYQASLNAASFSSNKWNPFMHYALHLYNPDLTSTAKQLVSEGEPFLARKGKSPLDGRTYYTLVVGSPTGKVYELTSPRLDDGIVESIEWTADECPACHFSKLYDGDTLDKWWATNKDYQGRLPTATQWFPVRVSIGSSHVDNAADFWRTHFPVLDSLVSKSGLSRVLSVKNIHYIFQATMQIEVTYVENNAGFGAMKHSVDDYITYINSVKDAYAGSNRGWSAWYDRHLGLGVSACTLDPYMRSFESAGIAFTPHETSAIGQHFHSEGVEGYGLEFQGTFDYSFQAAYSGFDFCTWNTLEGEWFAAQGLEVPQMPDPAASAFAV